MMMQGRMGEQDFDGAGGPRVQMPMRGPDQQQAEGMGPGQAAYMRFMERRGRIGPGGGGGKAFMRPPMNARGAMMAPSLAGGGGGAPMPGGGMAPVSGPPPYSRMGNPAMMRRREMMRAMAARNSSGGAGGGGGFPGPAGGPQVTPDMLRPQMGYLGVGGGMPGGMLSAQADQNGLGGSPMMLEGQGMGPAPMFTGQMGPLTQTQHPRPTSAFGQWR